MDFVQLMVRVTRKKVFVILSIVCFAKLMAFVIFQSKVIQARKNLKSHLRYIPHSRKPSTDTKTPAMSTNVSIHGVRDNKTNDYIYSLFVHPGPSSLAFEKFPVLPYFYRLPQSHHPSDRHRVHQKLYFPLRDWSKEGNESKLILFYNVPVWYRKYAMSFCLEGLNKCPIKSCRCSNNPGDLMKADAVIVDGVELRIARPMTKQASQLWIFFALESPFHFSTEKYKTDQWRQMFNWTMTYRLDSDIPIPYDILLHRAATKNYTAIASKKTKSALWLVSNCNTPGKRHLYVKELNKHYNVDVFGECTKTNHLPVDVATLLNQYRFYLSFENSFCFDYITEKLFKTYAANINIVPVVRGGADYDAMLPKGTFINTAHFNSPRELGKYLAYLEKNSTAYNEFLQRNDQFVREGRENILQNSFCEVCVKMHNLKWYDNWYTDIGAWYNDGTCTIPTDY